MSTPLGYFISQVDATLTGGVDYIAASVSSTVYPPLVVAVAIYYMVEGMKIARGDAEPYQHFWTRLIRVLVILWLCSDMAEYNYYVRDLLCTGIPSALTAAVTSTTGADVGQAAVSTAFDNILGQMQVVASTVFQAASISVLGVAAVLVALMAEVFAGLALVVMAVMYIGIKFMMSLIVCIGPLLIAWGLFEFSKPFLERAIGKIVALILMQVVGFTAMSLILRIDQAFIVRVSEASISLVGTGSSALPQMLQELVWVILWFLAGSLGVLGSYIIAYSIGSGVSLSASSMIALAVPVRSLPGAAGGGRGGTGGGAPSYQLGLAGRAAGAAQPAALVPRLPAPPPSPISNSTRS